MAARIEPGRVQARHQSLHHAVAKAEWDDVLLLTAVRGQVLPSLELEAVITAYIDAHNADPKPFRWTKSAEDILAAVQRFCQRTTNVQAKCLETSDFGH